MTNNDAVLESLAAKINSLELTDDERGALGELFGIEPEVAGFSKKIYVGNLPVMQGFNLRESGWYADKDYGRIRDIKMGAIDGDFGPAT